MTAINELVKTAKQKFNSGLFDKFIHEMCFPKFKSFSPGATISFRFPITVLVGPNGGGKSSILHAAWGMPLKHSTSRFWFSTPVDPIDFDAKDQNRYWYSHRIKSLNLIAESRKMCGNKNHGYWEPTRPARKEGMKEMPKKTPANSPYMSGTGDRWTPVDRTSYYFNSKTETSAFDRFFNSTELSSLSARQDYFVKYSKKLKNVIDNNLNSFDYYSVERVSDNFLLSTTQLDKVNRILQKNYSQARYIRHKFYDKTTFSPSVIFQTSSRSYSECFAGSGELAVVNFVLALENIEPYGLLLLDEPETSLHPGAQERLIEYLLKLVNEKYLQIIISTHSQTFVELLPEEALVVLDETTEGVTPRALATKSSAFDRLGVIDNEEIVILTEDRLLKAIVDHAILKLLPARLRNKLRVVAADVGVSEMLSNQVRAHIHTDAKVLMVIDGDQSAVKEIFDQDPNSLSADDRDVIIDGLKRMNISIVGSKADLDSWMRWCKSRVVLLDKTCPEQILLELLNPEHPLLLDTAATNAAFKDKVRSVLNAKTGDRSPDAQYHTLKIKLTEIQPESTLNASIQSLSERLKEALRQFDMG